MQLVTVIAAALCAMASAGTASAAGDAGTGQFVVLDGFVKSVDSSGSAFKVIFHSNDGYSGADWTLEGPAPAALKASGWKDDAIKVGDSIDAVVVPDAGGAARGRLLRFLLADYRTLETGPYGSSLMYPPGAIKKTIAHVADDPLASAYANTLFCTASESKPADANHSCRMWINADHTLRVMKKTTFNGLNADGSFNLGADTGVWWVETLLGKQVLCTLVDNAPMPQCHLPVLPRKVGEKWTLTQHGASGDWTETWELQQGRRS